MKYTEYAFFSHGELIALVDSWAATDLEIELAQRLDAVIAGRKGFTPITTDEFAGYNYAAGRQDRLL